MTLIVSYQKDEIFLMVGDLMISSDVKQDPPIDLPTRFHKSQPATNPSLYGLSQKLIIINDHLAVAWAGKKWVAKKLIRKIASELTEPYKPEDILKSIQGSMLSNEHLKSVSFIFFGITPTTTGLDIIIQDYLAGEIMLAAKEKIKYAGSGVTHFLDSITFKSMGTSGLLNTYEEVVGMLISRLAIAFYHEFITDFTHKLLYGGGFELLLVNPVEKRIVKMPITFVFWKSNAEGVQLTGPILTLNYSNDGYLYLHRITASNEDTWTLKSYVVSNLLNESTVEVSPVPSPQFNTFLSVHYFVPTEGNTVRMMVKKGAQSSLLINYSAENRNIEIKWTQEFMQEVKRVTS